MVPSAIALGAPDAAGFSPQALLGPLLPHKSAWRPTNIPLTPGTPRLRLHVTRARGALSISAVRRTGRRQHSFTPATGSRLKIQLGLNLRDPRELNGECRAETLDLKTVQPKQGFQLAELGEDGPGLDCRHGALQRAL